MVTSLSTYEDTTEALRFRQVPIDKPYEAHDILLRFTGIDAIKAAGAGSKIPSTIGQGNGGVLGKISPDGDTLDSVKSELEKQAAAVDKAASDAVDKAGEEGQPIDKERELLYGPRRSVVLFLTVISLSLAIYGLLRWRARIRHRRQGWAPKHLENKHHFVPRSESGYRLGKLGSPPPSSTYYGRRARQMSAENSPKSPQRTPLSRDRDAAAESQHPPRRTRRDSMEETARTLFAIEDEEEEDERSGKSMPPEPRH